MDSFLPSLYCFTEWAEWLLATVLVNRLIVVSLCRYSYMIDNIILLITGTLHQRQIAELRSKCHPLGSFEEMESVNIANTPAELYEAVLVDTPLGKGGGGRGGGEGSPHSLVFLLSPQLHISRVVFHRQTWTS